MRYLAFVFFVFLGCGYKPVSTYTKQEINQKVYVQLKINKQDVVNSMIIKDNINNLIISRFGASIVNDKTKADTIMNIELPSIKFSQIQYSEQGFTSVYRINIEVKIIYNKNDKQRVVKVIDFYDFVVQGDSIVSDTKRQTVVKNAVSRALEEVEAKIAIESFRQ